MHQKIIKRLKDSYKYFKMGVAEERKENDRARVESNIKGVRNANPDMADRMEEEYKRLKKKGRY